MRDACPLVIANSSVFAYLHAGFANIFASPDAHIYNVSPARTNHHQRSLKENRKKQRCFFWCFLWWSRNCGLVGGWRVKKNSIGGEKLVVTTCWLIITVIQPGGFLCRHTKAPFPPGRPRVAAAPARKPFWLDPMHTFSVRPSHRFEIFTARLFARPKTRVI